MTYITAALGMIFWLLILLIIFGQWCRYRDWRIRRRAHAAVAFDESSAPIGARQELADEAESSEWDPIAGLAHSRYLSAWDALGGRAARLGLLAVASDEVAQRCREAALTHTTPCQLLGVEDYCGALPGELRDSAGRPGDPQAWQALDRALARLSAIIEIPDAGVHADAYERVSIAARELADELAELDICADVYHCWFCGRDISQVEHLLCSAHAAICDDCVQACHEQLSEL